MQLTPRMLRKIISEELSSAAARARNAGRRGGIYETPFRGPRSDTAKCYFCNAATEPNETGGPAMCDDCAADEMRDASDHSHPDHPHFMDFDRHPTDPATLKKGQQSYRDRAENRLNRRGY